VVGAFLAAHPGAAVAPWPESHGRPPGLQERSPGWQLLPGGDADTDGFYYACLTRK
jgi:16S rRNA C967 or C1407 C5-methylase (RsmB/RsmF family)